MKRHEAEKVEPNFVIRDTIARQTYGKQSQPNIQLFIAILKSLSQSPDELCTLLCSDGNVMVEFTYGQSADSYAPAETFLYAEIEQTYLLIEDLEDKYLSVSFPWNKLNKQTKFKISIKLGRKWLEKANNPAGQLCDLIHEYSLHGIPYARFIQFVRIAGDEPAEVALHYFYYAGSRRDNYLNAVAQHSSHATKQKTLTSATALSWNNYSGNPYYNQLIQIFRKIQEVDEKALLIAAVTDVNKQTRDPSAGIKLQSPPKTVTTTSVLKISVRPNTFYSFLQGVALCSCGDVSQMGNISMTIRQYLHFQKEDWISLLTTCYGFFSGIFGDVFGLNEQKISAVLDLALSDNSTGQACTITIPQPRELIEAWVVYVVCGGYRNATAERRGIADELVLLFQPDDWQMITCYKTYRLKLGHLLQNGSEIQNWSGADEIFQRWK